MKTQDHGRILAIIAAAMIGIAMPSSAVLARGGGGFGGGHFGGFAGAHMGAIGAAVVGGAHVGNFGIGHMGGPSVHPMGIPGIAMDRGFDDHGHGRTHVTHELGHRHFRGLYGVSPYDNCPWSADLTIENCPVGSVTE
jgi:hypothetical protein